MSNTSYSFKENSHVIVNQGGEKKVMKKILSVALSTAMAFSMFASVAFGADAKLTPEQQFNALKEAGIVSGFPDGLSHLERTLTRAELAKIIVNSLSLEPVDATSYNDKNYANHWGRPYIEAATQAGILNGKDAVKKLFDPNGAVTVQELAKVLVTALKLEVPADANNTASEWAKGYVAAAVNAGYLADGINYQAQATRSQAVVAAYAIYEAAQVPTVKSYNVVDSKNVEFTLSNGEVVKVTLEKELVPNTATEVTFKTADGKEIKTSVTWVVTDATKVESVSADNLKEVVVKFDGEVDKATAELVENYKISSDRTVKTAELNDAKNQVTLTLEDGKELKNQQKYTLTVTGVKAGSKTIEAKEVVFAPVDNKLPEVVSVTSLGTKAVKVEFSEPIKTALTGAFQLDGKAFYGQPKINNRVVVLKAFDSSTLTVGEHTLSVSDVQDYNDFKSLKSEHKFTVVEDTTPPTIAEATATLEKLTVTFSEDVDPDTVDKDKVYWKSGDTKVTASDKKQIAGNKYEFYFYGTGKALPSYETAIYVEGVKDYSGNEIKETSKLIKAEVDYERPYVVSVKVDESSNQEFVVTFNKNIKDKDWKDNVKVVDKDGKVQFIESARIKSSSEANKLVVKLFNKLPEGTNKLTLQGIKDATVLENTMLDYTTELKVGDKTGPKVASAAFNITNDTRRVIIVFDEKIDTETLVNPANYILLFGSGPNYNQIAIPSSATLTPIQDSKAVIIDLPEEVASLKLYDNVNAVANLKGIKVIGIKDAAGNYYQGFSEDVIASNYTKASVEDYDTNKAGVQQAALTGTKQIKVKLNQAVSAASVGNVTVASTGTAVVKAGTKVTSIDTNSDSNVITLNLNEEVFSTDGLEITFVDGNTKFTTVAGNVIALDANTVLNIGLIDQVLPSLKDGQDTYKVVSSTTATYDIAIDFNEDLDRTIPENLLAQDLIVTRLEGSKNVPVKITGSEDLSFEVLSIGATEADGTGTYTDASRLVIRIYDNSIINGAGKYSIEFKDGARYIQDIAGNAVAAKAPVRTSN